MSYTKVENALKSILPADTYKVQAVDGVTRYLIWTPTGTRMAYANGVPVLPVSLCVVTAATQTEDDTLPDQAIAALAAAHVAVGQPEQSYDDNTATYYTDIPCEVI